MAVDAARDSISTHGMALTQLSLTDFRNYATAHICPTANFIVLHGENGAGKTNILEAVSLLVPGRGLRRAALQEMSRKDGENGFAVSACLGDIILGTGTEQGALDRRKVRINGASSSINALAEWLAVIWLTPAMDRLFADSAGVRRRFLDRLVLALYPSHAKHSSRYEKAVQGRNRLLQSGERLDLQWMDAIESEMAQDAARINAGRNYTLAQLSEKLASAPTGPFAVPTLQLAMPACEDVGQLQQEWRRARSRDAAAKRTLLGPHRTDLIVHHAGNGQAAASCSTGEQKALLLSVVLAHATLVTEQRGGPPIILLDEVAAHIDPVRRRALFEKLAQTGCQVWMTGTELGLFRDLEGQAHFIEVDGGTLL